MIASRRFGPCRHRLLAAAVCRPLERASIARRVARRADYGPSTGRVVTVFSVRSSGYTRRRVERGK